MKYKTSLVTLLLCALASSAYAEVKPGTENVTTSESNLMDHLYLNYFAVYHGGPLRDPSSPYMVDQKGALSSKAINLDTEITTAYLLGDGIGIGPDIPFLLVPVFGQGLVMGDVGIKAFNSKTIYSGGLRVGTNILVQAPTNGYSQQRNMTVALKSTPFVRYDIPRSRFTVGAWTEIKEYFGVTFDKSFKAYAEPYVNYQLSRRFSLSVAYEMEAHHNVGDLGMLSFTNYQTDLQTGFIWAVTPKIFLNPYLQFFTTNRATLDTSALGATINATLL
jgi:hypothetical protein